MSAREWGPQDWLSAGSADLPHDPARSIGNRVRYRIARGPLLRPVRAPDGEPSR